MESDCLSLLPTVCKVLADPKLVLPDDTCLEKLLDWFKELVTQNDGQFINQHQSCLLQFLESVTKSIELDPIVFSFTLKLTGLLAANEDNFKLLEERKVLLYLLEPDKWHKLDLWKNASVRCGWLQGLWNMLQHQQAMDFFCNKGLIKLVFSLENDESLFVGSLSNQVIAHILNFIMPHESNNIKSGTKSCSSVNTDYSSVVTKVISHVANSLASEEHTVILSGLRLLAVVLAQCDEPLKEMWTCVLEPLELLVHLQDDSLTQPIMAVLQAAASRSALSTRPECRVGALMDAMLCSRNTNESVKCAALILQLGNCPQHLKSKATDVILLPLLCLTASSQSHVPDGGDSLLENQLSQRVTCVSLLTQSLFCIEHLVCMVGCPTDKLLDNIPILLITSSVISLLRICIGHHTPPLLKAETFSQLIGCCKVQRCSLDVLGSVAIYKESKDLIGDALAVLLIYLQCPDLHATVLNKAYQAILKWFSTCSLSPDLWKTVSLDLFPLLEKHICDERWEVRDSTLEFIMHLTATLKGNSRYAETLHNSGMISVLFTSLSDEEGFVRASAVSALGEALTTTDLPLCKSLQEKAVEHLLDILTHDTESFPRRAVVTVFRSWLKCSNPFSVFENPSSVLSVGGSDFDWEVKLHTLELAEMLMENSLSHCPHSLHTNQSSKCTCIKHALNKLLELGLFDLLLKCLFDCDRPVSRKACTLLLKLRAILRETFSAGDDDLALEISTCSWGEEMLQRYQKNQAEDGKQVKNQDREHECPKKMSLFNTLELLDLEDMQCVLSLSSDYVINSPRSVMEDILLVTQQSVEKVVDCY